MSSDPNSHPIAHQKPRRATWEGPGWSPPLVVCFLEDNRNWQAVRRFWSAVVGGAASIQQLGLDAAGDQIGQADGDRAPPSGTAVGAGSGIGSISTAVGTGSSIGSISTGGSSTGAVRTAAPCTEVCDGTPLDTSCSSNDDGSGSSGGGVNQAGQPAPRKQQKERTTYKVWMSYYGPDFDGWMHQQHLNAVEGVLTSALWPLCNGRKPVVAVAGRTDKNVSACWQVCSFYSWQPHPPAEVLAAINAVRPPSSLRAWKAETVPRTFHATFSAKWRRYVYLLPLRTLDERRPQRPQDTPSDPSAQGISEPPSSITNTEHRVQDWALTAEQRQLALTADLDVDRVDALLSRLVGRQLDFNSFARDTPKGKDGLCTLAVARARLVVLPALPAYAGHPTQPPASIHSPSLQAVSTHPLGIHPAASTGTHRPAGPPTEGIVADSSVHDLTESSSRHHASGSACSCGEAGGGMPGGVQALCVELVGNRFLRRMVRVLVSTAVRESIQEAARYPGMDDALVRIAEEGNRLATAPPAPGDGLCFCGVGYGEDLL